MENKETVINDLEPMQYQDIYHEDDVPLNDIGQTTAHKMLLAGVLIVLVNFIASILITIPREVNIPFELKGGKQEDIIQFQDDVYVINAYVEQGVHIKRGAPLLAISSPKILELVSTIKEAEKAIELYDSVRTELNKQEISLIETRRQGIKRELNHHQKEIAITESTQKKELTAINKQLILLHRQQSRIKELHNKGVISDANVDQILSEIQEKERQILETKENYRHNSAQLRGGVEALTSQSTNLAQEIQRNITRNTLERAEIESVRDAAIANMKRQYGNVVINDKGIDLLSPAAGKVTLLTSSDVQVPSEQMLLRLQTHEQAYFAYALGETGDIGLIATGERVVLKFTGLPHYYYGTMKGIVASIAESSDAKGHYPIKITVTEIGKLEAHVTKGMTGVASIIVEEKPIIDYIFRVFLEQVTFK